MSRLMVPFLLLLYRVSDGVLIIGLDHLVVLVYANVEQELMYELRSGITF